MNIVYAECIAFLLLTVLLAGLSRRAAKTPGFFAWGLLTIGPLLWIWGTLFLLDLIFFEFQMHEWSPAFLDGSSYALSPKLILRIASAAALLSLPLTALPGRVRTFAAVALGLWGSFVVFSDTVYVRYFGSIVPFWALAEAHQLADWYESIRVLVSPKDALLLCFPLGALFFAAVYRFPARPKPPSRRGRFTWHISVFLVFVLASGMSIRVLYKDIRWRYTVWRHDLYIMQQGVINTHLADLLRTLWEWRSIDTLTPGEKRRTIHFFRRHAAQVPESGELFGEARGKNVLLVQVESLQQFVLGTRVNGQEVTPFLNRLCKEALYYPFVFDQTADGTSADAEFAVLNSLYPLDRGSVVFRRPYNHFVALPWLLKRAGYSTLSAHAAHPHTWNMSIIHPRYGFERSLFGESLGEGERFGVKKRLADHVFLKRMVPEIEKLPKPFFAFLITITSHHPYVELPAHHKVLETGHLENAVLSGYLHSMHYVDRCLEDLFRDLKEAGLLEETVVAIYGDHDARIRPKHDLYDFLGYEKNNFSYLAVRSWLDRVPLIIAVPGGTAKGEIREVGGHVDIAPTLLYLLGIRQPACFIGEALIPGGSNTAVLTSPCWGSAVTQDRMYIKKYKGYEDICVDPVSREIVPDEMCDVLKKQAEMTLDYSSLAVLHDLAREIAGFDTGEEKRPITE